MAIIMNLGFFYYCTLCLSFFCKAIEILCHGDYCITLLLSSSTLLSMSNSEVIFLLPIPLLFSDEVLLFMLIKGFASASNYPFSSVTGIHSNGTGLPFFSDELIYGFHNVLLIIGLVST